MMTPNNNLHEDSALFSVWATLEQAIRELQLVHNRIHGAGRAA